MTIRPSLSYCEAMLKILPIVRVSVLFLIIVNLFSCANKPVTIHILTDRKELASAVEIFDAAENSITLTIRHVPIIDAGIVEIENPDLIIGSDLNSLEIIDLVRPLETDFPVYQALTGPADSKGRKYLIPLAFEMPLIMGKKSVVSDLPDPIIVRPDDLRDAALSGIKTNGDDRLTHLGFSPDWNLNSYTDLMMIKDPFGLSGGVENMNRETLSQVITETRDWIVESAGSLDADKAFSSRYRYIPDEYLILEGRTLFARTDFDYWASLPDTTTRDLDIRYFSGPRQIPVTSVTYAAVPAKSKSLESSMSFISWLLLPETQSRLLSRWERDGIQVFGVFGGLSSLPEVNNSILIRYFPEMKGKIPEGHYLSVTDMLPHRWSRIRDEVITPWFQKSVFDPDYSESLTEAYGKWDLSSLAEAD